MSSDLRLNWRWEHDRLYLDFPLHAVPKPKATGKGWHANRGDVERYKSFRDLMRIMLAKIEGSVLPLDPPLLVTIIVRDWNPDADPDNVEGGILDALKPWPLPNDRWREICSLHVLRSRTPEPGAGFTVVVRDVAHDNEHGPGLTETSDEATFRAHSSGF